jgi:hypothetical protein
MSAGAGSAVAVAGAGSIAGIETCTWHLVHSPVFPPSAAATTILSPLGQ